MDEIPVTRAYLESLTTAELVRMADNWGIDIPPDLDRIFVIEELLDAALDEAGSPPDEAVLAAEPEMADSDIKESVPLPKQYNITFIEVMIRDPHWAFVFWEIKTADREVYDKSQDFDGYYLKVSSGGKTAAAPRASADAVFTVPVKPDDNAWYLSLSSPDEGGISRGNEIRYKVELCAGMKGDEIVVAASAPFSLPGLQVPAVEKPGFAAARARPPLTGENSRLPPASDSGEAAGLLENPLIHLSGYGDFHVIRSNERTQRAKRGSAESYE